jgi:hypothetical protein
MPERRFYPYAFASDSLALHVEEILIDSSTVNLEEVYDRESAQIGIVPRVVSKELRLRLVVADQTNELADVLQEGETVDSALAVGVRLAVRATRVRRFIPFVHGDDGRWRAEMIIPAAELADRLTLSPAAIRLLEHGNSNGRASHRSEQVADGKPVVVELDKRPIVPGNALDAEWCNFGADESPPELRRRSDLAWFLDFTKPDRPKLFLNDGLYGFRQALEAPALRGLPAALRDALIGSVLQPVLVVLALEALAVLEGVSKDSDGEEDNDPAGWQQDVLVTLARNAGEATADLQVERWRDAWRNGNRAEVTVGLQTAVQRHLGSGQMMTGLLTELGEVPDA